MNSISQTEISLNVLFCAPQQQEELAAVLARYDMQLILVDSNDNIPGSYWGDSEAGIIENRLYVRSDTPVHSALHEACHYICMDKTRRQALDTDAGGGYDEENGVCYLQILLSDHIASMGKQRMFVDMDAWGYSFRLGSSQAWFEQDAEDARQWLLTANLITQGDQPTWLLRQ